MTFDSKQFLNDFGIPIAPPGAKQASAGWVNIRCPHCSGSPGWHGGFSLTHSFYNCRRCGWHPLPDVIMQLTGYDFPAAKSLLKQYEISPVGLRDIDENRLSPSKAYLPIPLPEDCQDFLEKPHRTYLHSRGFDPDELEQEWELKSTGHKGKYKFRIIAPINLDGKPVSYQGRDITERQDAKYKACPKEEEIVHHKHTLYGIDKAKGKTVIVVEGITDVWRIGPGTVGTFGIEFTMSQVRMLADRFDKHFIYFDPEPQAQAQADKLGILLEGMGKEVEILTGKGDPGEMDSREARELKVELLS